MALVLYANNASTTLAGGISPTALSMNLAGGTGSLFPNPTAGAYFVMTLQALADAAVKEIVWVTARTGDTCTIVRAQEGTTALAWLSGDKAANYWTAGSAAALVQVGQLQLQATNYAVDTGTDSNVVITLNPSPGVLPVLVGAPIRVKIAVTNTAIPTLNVNGLGATGIRNPDGNTLFPGQLLAGGIYTFVYDGTWFQLQSSPYELISTNNTFTGLNAYTQFVSSFGGFVAKGVDPGGAQIRVLGGNYGVIIRNDGSNVNFLQTPSGQQNGVWNNIRPFSWSLTSGVLSFDGTGAGSVFGGNVNIAGNVTGAAGIFSGALSANGNITSSGTITSNGIITANAGRLRATGGTTNINDPNTAPILNDFFSLIGGSGFQVVPSLGTAGSGSQLFFQWFTITAPGNGSPAIYSFPNPFPHASLFVIISYEASFPPSSGNIGAEVVNNSQFRATNSAIGAANGCNVFAIGY